MPIRRDEKRNKFKERKQIEGNSCAGGVCAHPLKETMIAGNFFEMLKNIAAVGAEVECYCNAFHAPSVLVDAISVSTG